MGYISQGNYGLRQYTKLDMRDACYYDYMSLRVYFVGTGVLACTIVDMRDACHYAFNALLLLIHFNVLSIYLQYI